MYSKNSQARLEKNQQRLDSGYVSKHYPEVESIIINMAYKQKGITNPIHRIMNFSPGSYAFFKISCLNKDCTEGGFDLSQIINLMINNHRSETSGHLSCDDNGTQSEHSVINYTVAIHYA